MPVGSALASGVVATIVCLAGAVMEYFLPDSSLFWSFFALNLVMLLLSYLPVFPAFLKLRKTDPETPRPFRVPGGKFLLPIIAYLPFVMIIAAILFTAVPLSFDKETLSYYLPITVGSLVAVLVGEVLIAWREGDSTPKTIESTHRAKGDAYANKN